MGARRATDGRRSEVAALRTGSSISGLHKCKSSGIITNRVRKMPPAGFEPATTALEEPSFYPLSYGGGLLHSGPAGANDTDRAETNVARLNHGVCSEPSLARLLLLRSCGVQFGDRVPHRTKARTHANGGCQSPAVCVLDGGPEFIDAARHIPKLLLPADQRRNNHWE